LASRIDIEEQLEGWIESDPGLLEAGLIIVGRQVRTEAGPLDLLAIDPQGRWVVIELKRGTIYRDTLTQALDYAACIEAMPEEALRQLATDYFRRDVGKGTPQLAIEDLVEDGGERELRVSVVGTSRDIGLERLTGFLSGKHGIPITVVTFEVYQLEDGDRVLVRQLAESETTMLERADKQPRSIEELCSQADDNGIGAEFRSLIEAARRHGLYLKSRKKSCTAAPQENRARSLFTVWTYPNDGGDTWLWLGTEAFTQFYPSLNEADVTAELGEAGAREMPKEQVAEFVAGLERLFSKLQRPSLIELGEVADAGGPGSRTAARELERLAEKVGIDPDDYVTWVEVAELLEKPGKAGGAAPTPRR
jgi:Holliday junction resolvase-like predicted endonuclease